MRNTSQASGKVGTDHAKEAPDRVQACGVGGGCSELGLPFVATKFVKNQLQVKHSQESVSAAIGNIPYSACIIFACGHHTVFQRSSRGERYVSHPCTKCICLSCRDIDHLVEEQCIACPAVFKRVLEKCHALRTSQVWHACPGNSSTANPVALCAAAKAF